MKAQTFIKEFTEYDEAFFYSQEKNKAFKRAGNKVDIYCVVPGPEDNYAVVDLRTAIDLEMGYVISSGHAYVENPFIKEVSK